MTTYGRGTESYRAPELIRETATVTKSSDIWALGCIIYALAFQKKAFESDFYVFECITQGRLKLEFPKLDTSERRWAYLRELIQRSLEIDWWKRPGAADILSLMDSLSNEKMSDSLLTDENASSEFEEKSVLEENDEAWEYVTWRRFWYNPSLSS